MTNDKRQYFRRMGKHFGFPSCCVEHFIETYRQDVPKSHMMWGTGFIPCPTCEQTKSVSQIVDQMIIQCEEYDNEAIRTR